jgi:hypothetical protein
MGATLPELVRGITGAVTREDARKLARLHGHTWKAVLKAMKRRARERPVPPAPSPLDSYIAAEDQQPR